MSFILHLRSTSPGKLLCWKKSPFRLCVRCFTLLFGIGVFVFAYCRLRFFSLLCLYFSLFLSPASSMWPRNWSDVGGARNWADIGGLLLYNNLEALLLFSLELLIMGELKKIKHEIKEETDWYSFEVILPVGLLCLFGLAISFFGFLCRTAISATGFTVLVIVNKLLTVVINLMIWDKHSTVVGTIGLLICMFGGAIYQQSASKNPNSNSKSENVKEVVVQEEEQEKLLEMENVTSSEEAK